MSATGSRPRDNARFVRYWLGGLDRVVEASAAVRWRHAIHKGGDYRKWYGNRQSMSWTGNIDGPNYFRPHWRAAITPQSRNSSGPSNFSWSKIGHRASQISGQSADGVHLRSVADTSSLNDERSDSFTLALGYLNSAMCSRCFLHGSSIVPDTQRSDDICELPASATPGARSRLLAELRRYCKQRLGQPEIVVRISAESSW